MIFVGGELIKQYKCIGPLVYVY